MKLNSLFTPAESIIGHEVLAAHTASAGIEGIHMKEVGLFSDKPKFHKPHDRHAYLPHDAVGEEMKKKPLLEKLGDILEGIVDAACGGPGKRR